MLGIHFAHIKNVVNELHQMGTAFIDFLDVIVESYRPGFEITISLRRVDHKIAKADDEIKRTAQFVAYGQGKAIAFFARLIRLTTSVSQHQVHAIKLIVGVINILKQDTNLSPVFTGFIKTLNSFSIMMR